MELPMEDGSLTAVPPDWCDRSPEYWDRVEATVNGMLGGHENLAEIDIEGSKRFFNRIQSRLGSRNLCLDVGAGIGRVSKDLLLNYYDRVSLLECNANFMREAVKDLPVSRIESVFLTTMQDFKASEDDYGRYDMVWIQWVIIYASDDHLCSFLRECLKLLRPGGCICIKDNVILPSSADANFDDVLLDADDCSITRSERYLLDLVASVGLELIEREVQLKFPKELFPVLMYCFKLSSQQIN